MDAGARQRRKYVPISKNAAWDRGRSIACADCTSQNNKNIKSNKIFRSQFYLGEEGRQPHPLSCQP